MFFFTRWFSAMNLQHSGKWPSDHKKCCNMMKSGIINLFPGTCPQFSLTSPLMGTYSCPGSNIIYTCVLSSSANAVITLWSGSAFQCPPTNLISLTQRVGGTVQPFLSGSCGSLSAVTTNVTSTCYTSVLTIPAVQALNGNSVQCTNGFTKSDIVGNDTVKIMSEYSLGKYCNLINVCPSHLGVSLLPSLPWSCWEHDSNQFICGPADSDLDPSHYWWCSYQLQCHYQ